MKLWVSLSEIISFLVFATLLIQVPDLIGNQNTVQDRIGIPSTLFLPLTLSLVMFFRLKKEKIINKYLYFLLLIIFPVTAIASVIFSILEFNNYPNYVYSFTRLNFTDLHHIAAFSLVLIVLRQYNQFFKKNYKKIIFFFVPIFLFYLYIMSLWPFDRFLQIIKEDHVIEYSQFFVLIAGGAYSGLLFKKLFQNKERILSVIFLFTSIALFLVAGDEISWGQRLLGFSTPENIENINRQNETTFHNISAFEQFVGIGYVVIGFYGAISGVFFNIIARLIKFNKDFFSYLVIPWYLFFFFFTGFIYNYYALKNPFHQLGHWSEVAELMLYSGISIFIVLRYYLTSKPNK